MVILDVLLIYIIFAGTYLHPEDPGLGTGDKKQK